MISDWDDYVELPSQFDIHEYRIMEDFAQATSDPRKQELLLVSLSGRGAFRRFKDSYPIKPRTFCRNDLGNLSEEQI